MLILTTGFSCTALHVRTHTHTHTINRADQYLTVCARVCARSHFAEPLSVDQQGQDGHRYPNQEHHSAQTLHHPPERL